MRRIRGLAVARICSKTEKQVGRWLAQMIIEGDGGTSGRLLLPRRGRRWVLAAIVLGAAAVWILRSGPILLHFRFPVPAQAPRCIDGEEYWGGTVVMNPARSRAPERSAQAFLLARSRGECPPGMSSYLCNKYPFPVAEWRLLYRQDTAREVDLYYRVRPRGGPWGCGVIKLQMRRVSGIWQFGTFACCS
jgi:hypothetical protein